jgi:hypothetical protein
MDTGVLSLGIKRPGCEANHSPPSSAEVKNVWSYTSTLHTSCCLVKHKRQLYIYIIFLKLQAWNLRPVSAEYWMCLPADVRMQLLTWCLLSPNTMETQKHGYIYGARKEWGKSNAMSIDLSHSYRQLKIFTENIPFFDIYEERLLWKESYLT